MGLPDDGARLGPDSQQRRDRHGSATYQTPEPIRLCKSTRRGTSLAQLREVAAQAGAHMRVAHRRPGADLVVPAVVHWRVGHYAALVEQQGDRVLMRDPTFGSELWLSVATLDEEASGFFLVDERRLPPGWRVAPDAEASEVWGKGIVAGSDDTDLNDNRPRCPTCGGGGAGGGGAGGPGGPARGMAAVSIQMMLISTTVDDIPIWYTPPRGPMVEFKARYNQRDKFQPQTFSYSNLGPLWTFDWLSYLEDDPANGSAPVHLYLRGAGKETASGFNAGTSSYAPTIRTQAVVKRTATAPVRYERELPDGSVEVFAQPDGAVAVPRRVFLTEIRDPQGNALTFTYDAQLRLVAVTDAIGQVTTLAYQHATDPLKMTKVTDPFSRTATFTFDSIGRLASITDLLGLTSSFRYGPRDTIATVTTPYGTTRITAGDEQGGVKRWAELTDPLGGRERVHYGDGIVTVDPVVPAGIAVDNNKLQHRTTLYWDKVAMARAPEQRSSASEYVWIYAQPYNFVAASALHSIKRPLERRVWYAYQGGGGSTEGTVRQVSTVARVLDDGTSQISTAEYNSRGRVTKQTDPLGRETVYEYDASGLDLLQVKQKNGAGFDLLETRTYNSQHLPLTITDAAGQTTTYTYNAAGRC